MTERPEVSNAGTRGSKASDLEARISILEEIEAIRRQFVRLNELFDKPYDADGLARLWTETGYLEACDGQFSGRREIHQFFSDLAASFTLHYAINGLIDVDSSLQHATGHWYGWETPVVAGSPLIGAFTSRQEYAKVEGEWQWVGLWETAHFLCAVSAGWVHEAAPRQERSSRLPEK
jgi:hypothetical protein